VVNRLDKPEGAPAVDRCPVKRQRQPRHDLRPGRPGDHAE
jgi:hypothetical protein